MTFLSLQIQAKIYHCLRYETFQSNLTVEQLSLHVVQFD